MFDPGWSGPGSAFIKHSIMFPEQLIPVSLVPGAKIKPPPLQHLNKKKSCYNTDGVQPWW